MASRACIVSDPIVGDSAVGHPVDASRHEVGLKASSLVQIEIFEGPECWRPRMAVCCVFVVRSWIGMSSGSSGSWGRCVVGDSRLLEIGLMRFYKGIYLIVPAGASQHLPAKLVRLLSFIGSRGFDGRVVGVLFIERCVVLIVRLPSGICPGVRRPDLRGILRWYGAALCSRLRYAGGCCTIH